MYWFWHTYNPETLCVSALSVCSMEIVIGNIVIIIGFILLVCFGLVYAWYVHETVVGRHAETGFDLSENHVYPVGDAAHVARCWHGYALVQSDYL
jgi:hypothetical protein